MTTPEPGWSALKRLVAEALERPPDARQAWLEDTCPDPARRAEAARLLRACEAAAASSVLDRPAAWFAEPLFADEGPGDGAGGPGDGGGDPRGGPGGPADRAPQALQAALSGRYTIERELGRGGMATVYLARDERHARPVALKLLHPELLPDVGPTRDAARFQREIEFAARLSHPHILPLHDSGAADGLLYYITPYVDGETLRERLRRTGGLSLSESLQVLRDVARALDHAHRRGVVHRDVKPANILLTRDGDALVADFGVAKGLAAAHGSAGAPEADLTEGALVLGTPAYMAPEQVTGDPGIDHRADLYALGAVAYELLTGAPPFAGRPRHEQLAAHVSEPAEPLSARQPDVPEALAALVGRLLAKSPDGRPADAAEVLRLLDAAAAGPGAVAGPGSAPEARGTDESGGAGRDLRRSLKLLPALAVLVLLWSSTPMQGTPSSTAGVAAATSPRAAATPSAEALARGTADPEAYDLYRKGRHLASTRQRDGLYRALGYFEEAAGRDSTYARAFAGIADAWTFLGIFGHVSPREAYPKARAAAERAVALDSRLVEAHAVLAHLMLVYEWNWQAAESAIQRAIALNPRYPPLRIYFASFLHSVGRPEEALAQMAVARELDPLAPTGIFSGRIYVDTQRPDEAIRVLREQVELEPRLDVAHQFLALAYLQKGMPNEAIASMRRAAALSGARDSLQLAYVYAKTGEHGEARRILARLEEDGRPLDPLGFHLAMAHAALGEPDEAFRWLEAAYAARGGYMNLLAVATGFEPLRSDPRFDDMLRRMGLR